MPELFRITPTYLTHGVPESSSEAHEFGLDPVILIQSVSLHLTRLIFILAGRMFFAVTLSDIPSLAVGGVWCARLIE